MVSFVNFLFTILSAVPGLRSTSFVRLNGNILDRKSLSKIVAVPGLYGDGTYLLVLQHVSLTNSVKAFFLFTFKFHISVTFQPIKFECAALD